MLPSRNMEAHEGETPDTQTMESLALSLERSIAARKAGTSGTVSHAITGTASGKLAKSTEQKNVDDIDVLRRLVVVPWAKKGKQVKFNMNSNTVELTHPAEEYERCELIDDEQMMESAKMWYLHEQDVEAKRQENVKQAEKAKTVELDLIAQLQQFGTKGSHEATESIQDGGRLRAQTMPSQSTMASHALGSNTGINALMQRMLQMEEQLAQAQRRVQQLEKTSTHPSPTNTASDVSADVRRTPPNLDTRARNDDQVLPTGKSNRTMALPTMGGCTDTTAAASVVPTPAALHPTPTKIPVRVVVSPAPAAATTYRRASQSIPTHRATVSPSPSTATPQHTRRSSADRCTELDWDEGHLAHVSFCEETRPRAATGAGGGAQTDDASGPSMVPPPLPPRQYAHMLREVQNLSGLRTPADTPPAPISAAAAPARHKSGGMLRIFKRGKKSRTERERPSTAKDTKSIKAANNHGEDTSNPKTNTKPASKQALKARKEAAKRERAEIKMLKKHAPDLLHEELRARESDRARQTERRVVSSPEVSSLVPRNTTTKPARQSSTATAEPQRTRAHKASPLTTASVISASSAFPASPSARPDLATVADATTSKSKSPALSRRWSFTNLFGGARSRAAGSISPGGTTHSASQRENSPRITKTQQGSTRRRRHSIGGDIFARFKRSAKSSKTKIPHDHAIGLCFDDTDDPNQSYHDHGPLKGTLEFADRPCVLSDLLTTSKSLSSLKTVSVAGGSEKRTSGTSTGSKAYTSSTPNRKSSGNRTQDAGSEDSCNRRGVSDQEVAVGKSKIPTPRPPFKTLNQSYETAV